MIKWFFSALRGGVSGTTLLPVLVFLFFSFVFHWQSVIAPITTVGSLPTRAVDQLYHAWVMDWDIRAIFDPARQIFHAPLFAPAPYTLAYSEHVLGIALLMAPITLWYGAMASYSVMAVCAAFFTALSVYGLVRVLGGDRTGAYFAGIIAAFAGTRTHHAYGHLHVVVWWWIPLALIALHRYHATGKRRWLVILAACVVAQGLFSFHGLVFFMSALAVVGGMLWWGEKNCRKYWLLVGVTLFGSVLLLLPLLRPYWLLAQDAHYTRSTGEHMSYAPSVADWFVPPYLGSSYGTEQAISPGLVPLLLLVFGAGALVSFREESQRDKKVLMAYVLLIVISLVLAFGPSIRLTPVSTHFFPGPYGILGFFPGFSGIRAVGRFAQLALLGVAVFIGLTWRGMLFHRFFSRPLIVGMLVFGLIAECFLTAPATMALDDALLTPRPVDMWLRSRHDICVIAELPFDDFTTYETESIWYLYHTKDHGKSIVNGYSGYYPITYPILEKLVYSPAASLAVPDLRALTADTLILHSDLYPPAYRQQVIDAFLARTDLQLETRFLDTYVFRVSHASPRCS